ncbi:CapA family protein [Pseudonocardiaceae bacterium YIM PH 21723]|nr:CapA family protein [Pseudonocardiaceae bacterium YIM PH 21723]
MVGSVRSIAALLAVLLLTGCTADPVPRAVPAPQPSTTTASPDQFTLVAAGDLLIHPLLTEQAVKDGNGKRDYRQILQGMKPVIEGADLALCHMEIPLLPDGSPFTGYPDFGAPPEIAQAAKDLGYDGCDTASNHTMDKGPTGVKSTLDILDAAGLKHTGSARNAAENVPAVYPVKGAKLAHLAYTYGYNGRTLPADKPWIANTIDPQRILADARKAKAEGADIVVVSLHQGDEYKADPTGTQVSIAKQLTADPSIDLLLGHHAHVVQPFEKVNGKWVVYGLGNQVARHSEPQGTTEEGVTARFTFQRSDRKWIVSKAEYIPTLVEFGPPIRLLDLTKEQATDRRKQALTRTEEVMLRRGAGQAGLTRGH